MVDAPFEVEHLTVHGHRRAYVKAGQGPALLLLHGLGCDHTTWSPVIEQLARDHTVIAPDLLGHGASAKPRADYSLGGYANGMRDLITLLGIDKVTVVGHSFGGGVAMQFAYQYPERTERIVLVASGGLGPEVTVALRAITTPGFDQAMSVLTLPGMRHVAGSALRLLSASRLPGTRDLDEVANVYDRLADPAARAATRHVVRAVLDWRGQVVTMADRAYLTAGMPMCVVWGEDDPVIPATHARHAAELAPEAQVELLADCGHFPHKDHPERFVEILRGFVSGTEPQRHSRVKWKRLLAEGPAPAPAQAEAGDAPVAPVRAIRPVGA